MKVRPSVKRCAKNVRLSEDAVELWSSVKTQNINKSKVSR